METFKTTYKEEVTFVRILIPFATGIIFFYGCRTTWILSQLAFLNIVLFLHLVLQDTYSNKTKRNPYIGIIFHFSFLFSGALCVTLYNDLNYSDYYLFKKSKYLKISIIEEPLNRQNIILFSASVTESAYINTSTSTQKDIKYNFRPATGKIKVSIMKDATIPFTLKYGDELIIPANFTETPAPSNPSEFNYKSWLALQNIYHQTILKQQEVVKLNTNSGNKLIRFALQLRERQVRIYRKLIKNDDAFAVAATLILGYRSDLSSEILEIYSKTGTIHALSVSGMHVGLVYLILSYLLWFLNKKQTGKMIKVFIMLSVIWFYTLLTGFSPSVLRASIMISVFIIAKLFNKNTNNYNIIAFAAFCLLLYNPFFIWDVGFQLSFMAVLGLIYLQPKIQQWLPIKQPWLAKVWGVIAMSLAAQLATYPFSVYYFHQFPIYFLLSNLFITIPTALIMYIGIITLLFRLDGLGPLFEGLLNFTNAGLEWIAKLPFSGITAIWLDKIELSLLCLSLILLTLAFVELKKQIFIYGTTLFLVLQCLITYEKLQCFHQKTTIKFKLPKNYAYVIISGHRAVLFTDLNPENRMFRYTVKPTLDQHMITRIAFRSLNVNAVLKDNLIFDQLN